MSTQYEQITHTTGACAVGYPGMMENMPAMYRGYVELWRHDEALPYQRVYCKQARWSYEAADNDAFMLACDMDGSASLYHMAR